MHHPDEEQRGAHDQRVMEDMLPPWRIGAGVDTNADGGSGGGWAV